VIIMTMMRVMWEVMKTGDDYDEDEEGDKDKESTYSSDGYAYASP